MKFLTQLNYPKRPPDRSWWTTVSRLDWAAIARQEAERMRGSREERAMRDYPPVHELPPLVRKST